MQVLALTPNPRPLAGEGGIPMPGEGLPPPASRTQHGAAFLILLSLLLALPARLGAMLPAPRPNHPPPTLHSGSVHLVFPISAPHCYGLKVVLGDQHGAAAFAQALPIAVDVVGADGTDAWLAAGYASITRQGTQVLCTGTVRTANGTVFAVTDRYRAVAHKGAFTVARVVTVRTPSAADAAFNTRFCLSPLAPTVMDDLDFFVPGVWYKDNAHVPPAALASQPTDRFYFVREDRLPLPLAAVRDKRTGITLTLAHIGGVPTTFAGESGQARIVDERMQFGALGILNTTRPSPAFLFPGSEGERTYIGGASRQAGRWAYRSHPVHAGVAHRYTLLLQLGRTAGFPAAVRLAWRTAAQLQPAPIVPVSLPKVYRDGMNLLDFYTRPYFGTVGVPFAARVPGGAVNDTSSQMGFVGQALPAAALLLQYALETGNTDARARATAVVDFWAQHSPTQSGLPRTWYDPHPHGPPTFRTYHTFLRVACDGMNGALQAWNLLHRHGENRPAWLVFCRRWGDWLARNQAADGSWAREYDLDGTPINPAKDTTDQAIPFLVNLSKATGEPRYQDAALRAGAFCRATVTNSYAYVGGTPDNPNATDKEGGMMALAAFLALYDIAQRREWLVDAAQAAAYSETWVYLWDIPMPPGDPAQVFPRGRSTVGLSLIATGHSGADNYMAAAPFLFYRVGLLTGDTHFCKTARLLLADTKQMTDWDSTLGYAQPGLLPEAMSLAAGRGHGVAHWLPWLTVAILGPMVCLRETYGTFDIDQINALPRTKLLALDAHYSRTHGFAPP